MSARIILGVSRAPFLALTLSVLFLAISLVHSQLGELPLLRTLLIVLCGLSAHSAVNALNEYHDFESGLDLLTRRTPFSGGSGTLPAHPEKKQLVLLYSFLCVAICLFGGLYLAFTASYILFFYGAIGLFLVLVYTPWINRNPWLCLVAPGTGFGLIMLPGAVLALHAKLNAAAWLAAFSVFFLVNNLLLLNQFPDIEADKAAGRRTLPVVKGRNFSLTVAGVFYFAVFSILTAAVQSDIWPFYSLGLLVFLPLPLFTIYQMRMNRKSLLALGANVAVNLLFPVLTAIIIILAVDKP